MQLSPESFSRAAAFLRAADPLHAALFGFHFAAAPAAPVQAALKALQNGDGGFWGLEPDVGLPDSTVLSTCHALHILHEFGTPAGHPSVQSALDYLLANYDPVLGAWPIIPPHDNSRPHAPWWEYSDAFVGNWGRFQDNPRPDVLACLHLFPCDKTRRLREDVDRSVAARIRTGDKAVDMHGLICHARLALAPGLPAELEEALDGALPGWIGQCVERDPAKWSGYGLRPLDVAPLAGSPWDGLLAADLSNNLDFLIQGQSEDGSWQPHWSWGDSFPEAWPAARRQWQAQLTLRALRSLASRGRIAK